MSSAQSKHQAIDQSISRPGQDQNRSRKDRVGIGPPVHSPFKIRDLSSPYLMELWLVSAVATILGVRLYLQLTGYPQSEGRRSTSHTCCGARWRW